MGNSPSAPTDLRTFARYPTIPQKVTNVSIHDKGPEPNRLESSDPMIEAGATSTEEVVAAPCCCARPTGVVMVASLALVRNVEGRKGKPAPGTLGRTKRGQGEHYRGRSPKPLPCSGR